MKSGTQVPLTFTLFRMKEHVEDASKKPILIFPEGMVTFNLEGFKARFSFDFIISNI